MDGQTQESLRPTWLTPEALVEFIDELRRNGFNIGVAEYVAAQDLLLMLAARGENLDDPQRAVSLLGPLLCSSPAEQESFPEFFHRWSERQLAKLSGQRVAHEETMAEALEDTAKRGLRWEWILFAVGVITLLGTVWYLVGNFVPIEEPAPGTSPTSSGSPGDPRALILLASVAVGLLVLAYTAWWAWWRRLADQFLQRRQGEGTPDIRQISLTASDEALFPSLTFLSLARLFRRRVQVVSRELNVVKTVEHSVEQGGWLKPIYDHLMIPPEYLVLVDRRTRFDHFAEFVEGMVKRLETHGVFITAYTFDGDPRLCFPLNKKDAPQPLSELAARYENMRLIIFSDAQGLLNPVSGRLAPWSRLFNRWIFRSILTPEPPVNWGAAEHELQREFIVLGGTADGLAAFMGIIQGQSKVSEINTWADSAIPGVLQERPQRWIERDSPSAAEIDSVLEELRTYLGEVGYAWFEACAIYPELHWQITITLGQLLKDGEGQPLLDSKRLIDLSRLPWFRYGIMPDWLRTRLILDLAPNREEEVRAALEALLVTSVQGHGEALDLEIAHERRDWTSRLARPLLRLLRREVPPDSPIQDHVFLDFMLQRLNLAVQVPATLRRQLFTRTGNNVGWRILLQWMIMNFLAGSAIIVLELLYPSFDRPLGPAMLITGFQGLLLGLTQWLVLRRFWKINGILWVFSCILAISAVQSTALAMSSAAGEASGSLAFASELGIFNLSILGLFQASLLAIHHRRTSRLWWFGNLLIGIFNTIWSLFFGSESGFKTELHAGVFYIVSFTVYSTVSGWILLILLRQQKTGSTWFLRPTWMLANAIGFSMGFVGGLIADGIANQQETPSNLSVGVIWALVFVFAQWLVLRPYHRSVARSWFWITLPPTGGALFLFLYLAADGTPGSMTYLLLFSYIGVGFGVIVGLIQTLIWHHNGLKPFQLLIWFLSSVIGFSFMFGGLGVSIQALNTRVLNTPPSLDVIVLAFLLPALLYGLVTSFPLESFLLEALRHQQVVNESGTSKNGFELSPVNELSKIRGQVSSTRAPL